MSHEPEYVRGAKAAIHFDGKRCMPRNALCHVVRLQIRLQTSLKSDS